MQNTASVFHQSAPCSISPAPQELQVSATLELHLLSCIAHFCSMRDGQVDSGTFYSSVSSGLNADFLSTTAKIHSPDLEMILLFQLQHIFRDLKWQHEGAKICCLSLIVSALPLITPHSPFGIIPGAGGHPF